MTTTERTAALTGTDWSELSRLIDAREHQALTYAAAVRQRGAGADSGPYEAAIRELRTWMNEHTDWGAS